MQTATPFGPGIFLPAIYPPIVLRPIALDKVPAGFPSPAQDYEDKRLDLNDLLLKNKVSTFFFRVAGESMIHAGIGNGDLVVADRSVIPAHGSIVVAFVNGERTVKRLNKHSKPPRLEAANPIYQPILINEGVELEIWGVVTSVIKQFSA